MLKDEELLDLLSEYMEENSDFKSLLEQFKVTQEDYEQTFLAYFKPSVSLSTSGNAEVEEYEPKTAAVQ